MPSEIALQRGTSTPRSYIEGEIVSHCDPHGRFTGGAAHSCAAGHTTYDKGEMGTSKLG